VCESGAAPSTDAGAVSNAGTAARKPSIESSPKPPPGNPSLYPSQHATLTALACLPLKQRGWSLPELAAFAAGGILIDVDHYLAYAVKQRDWSLPNAYRWHVRRVPPMVYRRPHLHLPPLVLDRFRPFHGLTPMLLAALLTRLQPGKLPPGPWRLIASLMLAAAWGALFHRLCDYSVEIFEDRPGIPTAVPKERP
jgi:hypothetical protein